MTDAADCQATRDSRRPKLGLALAGGGFRASLFHIGVLRRLAEFDLLRYVEVLSTVSGGSIVGGLYAVILKRTLEQNADHLLSRGDYKAIVAEVECRLLKGISSNLRTRLLLNPFRVLFILMRPSELGRHLATLLHRHFFRDIERTSSQGRFLLKDLSISSPTGERIARERHNRCVLADVRRLILHRQDPSDSVRLPASFTNLVLNATCLNSGSRFWFSAMEIGDWLLGHFHRDEIPEIERRKVLWEMPLRELRNKLTVPTDAPDARQENTHSPQELWMAGWLRDPDFAGPPDVWKHLPAPKLAPLRTAEPGFLRRAKRAAAELRRNPEENRKRTLNERFWRALDDIDDEVAATLAPGGTATAEAHAFVEELYLARTARVASPKLRQDLDNFTLVDAVAASANFPPILPPFKVFRFYDDLHVTRLGLTDGGVFENSGVQALRDEDCTHLIISDSSAPHRTLRRAAFGRLGMAHRISSILTTGIGWRQKDHVVTLFRSKEIRRFAWLSIEGPRRDPKRASSPLGDRASLEPAAAATAGSSEPAPLGEDFHGPVLARLRTDLDAFNDIEIAALVNHGYDTADRYLRRYFRGSDFETVAAWEEPPVVPRPELPRLDQRHLEILAAGRHRFARLVRLWCPAPLAQLAWLLGVGLGLMFLWVTVKGDLNALALRAEEVIASNFPRTWNGLAIAWYYAAYRWSVSPALIWSIVSVWLIAIVAGTIFDLPRELAVPKEKSRSLPVKLLKAVLPNVKWRKMGRRLARVLDAIRGGSFNILWLTGPVLAWIALCASLIAWVGFLAGQAFKWSARLPDAQLTDLKALDQK